MNRLKLENGLRMANMALCQQMGIPYDPLMTLADTTILITQPDLFRADHQAAVSNREEYRLMQDNLKAENLQYRMKLGEYLPELGVGVGAFTFDMDNNNWNDKLVAFGSLNIPITDWWEASHTLKQQKLKEEIAANQAEYTAQLLNLEMENA